jgi:hypothetical protein
MALSFPNNPLLGQEAVTGGKTWRWDGSRWQNVGVVGYQGSVGYKGSEGYQGSEGYRGSEGYQGSVGYTGSAGAPGGDQGYAGSQGAVGYAGSAGKTRFRDLEDVDIMGQANGYVVTYVSDNDKYMALPISVTNTIISNTVMDGGVF